MTAETCAHARPTSVSSCFNLASTDVRMLTTCLQHMWPLFTTKCALKGYNCCLTCFKKCPGLSHGNLRVALEPTTWKHGWSKHGWSKHGWSKHGFSWCYLRVFWGSYARTMFTQTMFSRGRSKQKTEYYQNGKLMFRGLARPAKRKT